MEGKSASALVLAGVLLVAYVVPFSAAHENMDAGISVTLLDIGFPPAKVNVGWLEDHVYWNPLDVVMTADLVFCYLMYSTLFTYDEDTSQVLPSLATGYYQVVETNLTLSTYINITSSAYFRNNMDPTSTANQLTAEDVAYTIQLIKTYPGGAWDSNVEDIGSLVVTDTFQLQVITDQPDSTLIEDLAWVPVLPKYVWQSVPGSQIHSSKNPAWLIGSGPFVYNSSSLDVYYTFDRAPNYHGAADFGDERTVKIESITYLHYATAGGLATALKQGDVDCACMSSYIDDYQNLTEGATVEITKYPTAGLGIYDAAINAIPMDFRTGTFGKGSPILLDPIVRKAILMTMDKDRIVNETMQGLGTRADSVLAPGFWHKDIDEVPYDPVAAHDLLVQNGYNDTDFDGTLECGPTSLPVKEGWTTSGTPLEFGLDAPDSDPLYASIAYVWAEGAQTSGISMVVAVKPEAIMVNNDWYKADYDLWVWAWSWGPEPIKSLETWLTSEIKNGGNNCQGPMGPWWYGPSNQSESPTGAPYSSYDQNLSLADMTLDTATKKSILDVAQQMVYDSYTETPPAYYLDLYGITEERYIGWGNWTQHPGRTILSTLLWTWFDLAPVPNEPPTASFTVTPLTGDTETIFEFNASLSSDTEDPVDALLVRWDWDNNSVWDTSWTTDKLAAHQFLADGVYTVVLQVQDTGGAWDTSSVEVSVVVIPEFAGFLLPVTAILCAMVVAVARRRRSR